MLIRFEKTLEYCNPVEGKSVLDIGCGPGFYSITLAKAGAAKVMGIDFAKDMIDIARKTAQKENVQDICNFEVQDFNQLSAKEKYDYVIIMGVMDYISDPFPFIQKTMKISNNKVLLSFPMDGGFLAWQRKIRYKFKCPLFLYTEQQLRELFTDINPWQYKIEKIKRDYFITLEKPNK